jgi:hypothetical protein
MLSAEFSSTVYVTTVPYLLCANSVVLGTFIANCQKTSGRKQECCFDVQSCRVHIEPQYCTKTLLKFFQWSNFHLYMPFSYCTVSYLIIVFTQNVLASTIHTFVGF